jgi:hypothetical protein
MPAQPFWLQRISDILTTAKKSEVPFLDRVAVQNLFGVRKRQAIRLMHAIGGYHVGRGFVVGRPELIAWLQEARNSPEARSQEAARERLEIAIEEARSIVGRDRKFIVSPDAVSKKLPGLPPTIQLKTGELKIEFFGTEDLLRQLFELSQAIGNDYARFQSLVEGSEA